MGLKAVEFRKKGELLPEEYTPYFHAGCERHCVKEDGIWNAVRSASVEKKMVAKVCVRAVCW